MKYTNNANMKTSIEKDAKRYKYVRLHPRVGIFNWGDVEATPEEFDKEVDAAIERESDEMA